MNSLKTRNVRSLAVVVAVLGLFASTAHAQVTTLTNGVAVTGISGTTGSQRFYRIEVPAGQDELEISTSGGTGDVDLYVRHGSQPTLTSYDHRPYLPGNNETVTIENPAAGTWFIMLHGYNAYANVTLLAKYSAAMVVTPLTNGVPVTNLSGAAGSELYFSIEVPASQTKLEISMSGGTGDADLYVKRGALPTTSDYDHRPYLVGNNESVTVNNPAAEIWYIMVRGFSAYSGVTLVASHGGDVGTLLQNGVPVTNISGAQASERIYRIEVPANQLSLEIKIWGGTGDADLYVKRGSRPTTTDYDHRPFLAGNDETVAINNPAAGTWFIMIRGYQAYSGLSLQATFSQVVVLQKGVPVTGLSGALNSQRFFRIDVPAGQDQLRFNMSGGTGNADMYIRKGALPTTTNWDFRPVRPDNTESISIGSTNLQGTWYVMLHGAAAYSGVTLVGDYVAPSTTVVMLTNGVPVTNISGNQNSERYYRIEVPSGQQKLEIQMSGGTGDADLYVRRGSLPTTSQYDFRPQLPGNNETVTVNNPTAGSWYIMVRGYQSYAGVTLVATFGGTAPDDVITLQNDVAVTGISGGAGSEKFYKIDVPAGQSKLVIAMSGGTGDADLYVRRGSKPTTSQWDHRPFLIGNNETVTIDNPAAGTYFIMIRGYMAYAGVTLKATYTPVPEEITELENGVPVTGLSGAAGSEKFYKITVPAGQEFLSIEMSGGTGDADLYVRRGSKPTLTNWDYRPFLIGNNESVEIADPAAAIWYIMLRGYSAYANVTLKATYGIKHAGNNFASDPNAVALWRFEAAKLTVDSLKDNTLSNKGATAETTDFKEGAGSVRFDAKQDQFMSITDANLVSTFPFKNGTSNNQITIGFWTKLTALPAWGQSHFLFQKRGTIEIKAYNASGNVRTQFVLYHSNGQAFHVLNHTGSLVADNWYHIAITFNNNTGAWRISVWDDTAQSLVADDRTGTTSSKAFFAPLAVVLGERSDVLLDEMVVFNRVLTPAEIAKIRQETYGKQ
jgi:large repetitive protein